MRPSNPGEPAHEAVTEWKALERFGQFTLLEVRPKTGRQHQIRVHLKWIGHPLAFDPDYGEKVPNIIARTPLHATSIRVPHPSRKGSLSVEAPLPEDFEQVLNRLRL